MAEDATDQPAIDRKADKRRRNEVTKKIVLQSLMQTTEGRWYVWNELVEAHVFHSTISLGPDGWAATAFREGQRSKGLELLANVTRWCPEQYLIALKENTENEDAPRRERRSRTRGEPEPSPRSEPEPEPGSSG